MDIKLRVGIVVTGSEGLDKKVPRRAFESIIKKVDNLDIEKIIFSETLSNSNISKKASKYFSENNVDLMLVIAGVWSHDNFLIDVTKFLNCPVICWSLPDSLGTLYPMTGSLVGALQNCGVLVKIGKKVKLILNNIENGFNKFKNYVDVLTVIKKLKFLNVGLIGSRCPGMLDSSFHELELRNQIGPEVIHISISDLIKEINLIKNKDADKVLGSLINKAQLKDINDDVLLESVKIYMATKKFVEYHSLDAIAFKCWPDLKNSNICTPCFTLSRLSDNGITAACESNVVGAVTMHILKLLTGNNAYLGDLLKINNETNEIKLYHCGAMPSNLAQNKKEIEYRTQGYADPGSVYKGGLTVEFPLKPGKVTFARVGEIKSKYRMISYTGNAVKSDMFVKGNPARIILDKNPEYIINGLIENGSEHHQFAVHGDITDKLKIFCEFIDLDLVLL